MAKGRSQDDMPPPDNWREVFLEHLAQTSNVSGAARAAKIKPGTIYRARRNDPEFAQAWFEALCEGYDLLELDLLRRLRMGDNDSPTAKRKRKYDNATSFRLLSAHRATVSQMRADQQQLSEDEVIASINDKLDRMRERMRAAEEEAPPVLPAPTDSSNDDEHEPGEQT
ncbi:hypothetical protein [Croceicoccus naphthovorans]|uniref:hypothetical protein n=1 Tax=Croceicoccus naphthovorans TaxID=1348774 RepID=UPI00069F415A|nr:hypothetical protein [Croceicoccus naphthovorans]MBB3990192.1 hypothetical protein [Croceicoccus naphthovorans]